MRLPEALTLPVHAQRGRLLCWAPVCLALGIGLYFALPTEPGPQAGMVALALLVALLAAARRWPGGAPLLLAAAWITAGTGIAALRAHAVAEPVIGYRYYGPITGRLVEIDTSASAAPRLTLDRVVLDRHAAWETPARVRVSLHGPLPDRLRPGDRYGVTGHLMPPGGPVEPGGFDFRRSAWFQRLGGVGYTRGPVVRLRAAEGALPVARVRQGLSRGLRERIPGEAGSFAAAITTGDRASISPETKEALRTSNLAHLLAISGLHMGLLSGFVYASLRGALSLLPWLALRWPVRKIAAGAAVGAGAAYLVLSGGAVATERAFVMAAVMFLAVICDRRAITLRAVALAALVVLLRRPEELLGPGFQMSFAATVALVVAFGACRGPFAGLPRWLRPIAAIVLSSLVAGLATSPFAAAHFNRLAPWGLLANLAAVPVMGSVVMPATVIAALLAPFGAEAPALWVMTQGLTWILAVAETVAGLPRAVTPVTTPGATVLPLLALGALVAILWRGRLRWLGLIPVLVALWGWGQAARPDLLVSEGGGLVGVMTPQGRALSQASADGFIAGIWLENDGLALDQRAAHELWPEAGAPLQVGPMLVREVRGKRELRALKDCGGADLLVSDQRDAGDRPCLVVDAGRLERSGALAVHLDEGAPRLVTARKRSGERLWSDWPEGPPLRLPRLQ